jgi:hypothetical protein
MAKCRRGGPVHQQLRGEMSALYNALKAKAREVEDAEDAAVEAMADVDATEIDLENAIRNIDAEAAKVDRADASRNAQKTIFPNGFGEVIDPEGEVQLTTLGPLRVRLAPFATLPGIAEAVAQLDQTEEAFRAALTADKAATDAVETKFAEEHEARRAIREQIESAYGRLRDLYKSRPGLAEAFFLNEGWRGKSSQKSAPAPEPAAPAPGAPAPT